MTASSYQITVLLPLALQPLSYIHSKPIRLFCRVAIPIGDKIKIGIVYACDRIDVSDTSLTPSGKPIQLKAIAEVIDKEPAIPNKLIHLIQWMTNYYHHWEGIIWQTALPRHFWLNKKPPTDEDIQTATKSNHKPSQTCSFHALNTDQQHAIQSVKKAPEGFQPWLLNGVTGSGKTEVYLHLTEHIIKKGKQVLILIPEIALTQQNIKRFSERFNDLFIYHSERSAKKREITWYAAKYAKANIVLGTRSAIFTPLDNLGLIIVDEEHDDSYRQHDGVHYSARDIAVMRAKKESIPVLLGSATPSFESLHNVDQKRYQPLFLPKRAGDSYFPKIRFIDMRQRKSILSDPLLEEIQKTLKQQQQSILFLNRRGYSPILICHSCGWIPECHHCQRPPTFHRRYNRLHCHLCDWQQHAHSHCPACDSNDLRTLGEGTEKIEELLCEQFPEARIARLDRDSTRHKGSMQTILRHMHHHEIDILLGTQMVSKGHDLPNVTLVGIINTDQGLLSPHYRAEEKLMQLITQVTGRAGRGKKRGQVLLQTHHPHHPTLQHLFQYGYVRSAQMLMQQRQLSQLPPYYPQALLRVECPNLNKAEAFIHKTHQITTNFIAQFKLGDSIILYPVVPASIERINIHYRMQFLIHSKKRPLLHQLLKHTIAEIKTWQRPSKLRWSLRLDPIEL